MRLSPAQIDSDIVDIAANLFARQGFERTSVQQVADAAGYSKTGLLHRFSSKQVLLDGVHQVIETEVDRLIATVEALPAGTDRMTTVLRSVTAAALAHPGPVLFMLNTVDRGDPDFAPHSWTEQMVHRLFGAILGADLSGEPALRLMLAMQLICSGAVLGCLDENAALRPRLPALLIEMAADVVGGSAVLDRPVPHPPTAHTEVPSPSPEGTR